MADLAAEAVSAIDQLAGDRIVDPIALPLPATALEAFPPLRSYRSAPIAFVPVSPPQGSTTNLRYGNNSLGELIVADAACR